MKIVRTIAAVVILPAILGMTLALPTPTSANSDSDNVCQTIGSDSDRSDSDVLTMISACKRAAAEHEQRARSLTGAKRQQQQLEQAGSLYFLGFGQIEKQDTLRQGVHSIAACHEILLNIRNHGDTPELRDKAGRVLVTVDQVINRVGNL